MADGRSLLDKWFWVNDAAEYVKMAITTDYNLEEAYSWALRTREKLNEFIGLLEDAQKGK